MTRLVFLDTETTGLHPDLHDVWEIGLIVRDPGAEKECVWHVRPDLTHADPRALAVGRYYERTRNYGNPKWPGYWADHEEIAHDVAVDLDGAVIVGSNPSFDQAFLMRWLRRHGQCWTAHYRTVDVITLGWGQLMAREGYDHAAHVPPSSTAIARLYGIDPDDYARHTALGDARWVRDLYDEITRGTR